MFFKSGRFSVGFLDFWRGVFFFRRLFLKAFLGGGVFFEEAYFAS